jgi:Zn-dependent protease
MLLAAVFGVFGAEVGIPIAFAALVGTIGGTSSLLIHELGHGGAARRAAGISSASISLFWLGAATRLEGSYRSGRTQMKVAIAGPLASFVVALSLIGACLLPMPIEAKEAVLLLAFFNVALAVFNLLPAYPFDGYKVVVGLLWAVTGSESKARRLLRRIGIGWVAVELSVVAVFLVERPRIGVPVGVLAAIVLVQRWFAPGHRQPFKKSR